MVSMAAACTHALSHARPTYGVRGYARAAQCSQCSATRPRGASVQPRRAETLSSANSCAGLRASSAESAAASATSSCRAGSANRACTSLGSARIQLLRAPCRISARSGCDVTPMAARSGASGRGTNGRKLWHHAIGGQSAGGELCAGGGGGGGGGVPAARGVPALPLGTTWPRAVSMRLRGTILRSGATSAQ